MSATGLDVFDKTLQITNIWLDEIMEEIGPDRQVAWHVLGAVLHTIRDRLTAAEAAHLGAQLPLLIRGLYYDQWRPDRGPAAWRTEDDFLGIVSDGMKHIRPVNSKDAARAVFSALTHHVTRGEMEDVVRSLPEHVRKYCAFAATPPERGGRRPGMGPSPTRH